MWTEKISKSLIYLITSFESYFISLQSILIWEQPYVSAVTLIAFNCVYWLIASWTRRIYSIFFLAATFLTVIKFWCNYIWPEIRLPPSPDADPEEWTPVHSQALSAPEISYYINEALTMLNVAVIWLKNLRKSSPGLFCLLTLSIFSVLALLGSLIPGVIIVYIILMTIALGPGLGLYLVPDSWFQYLKSFLQVKNCENENNQNSGDTGNDEQADYLLNKNALTDAINLLDNDENLKQIQANYSLENELGINEEKRRKNSSSENSIDTDKRSTRESSVSSLLNFVPTYFNGSSSSKQVNQANSHLSSGDDLNDIDIDEFEIVNEIDLILNDGQSQQQQEQQKQSGNGEHDDDFLESAL